MLLRKMSGNPDKLLLLAAQIFGFKTYAQRHLCRACS
jgi:hypothetical protein